ncbi:hypothetical protein L195_g041132 [Trifolium pratense]|uniref:RNase H type-1 domain-containing protein n=1 Tax=Trifolium pratense TaxID=57577 RepID=A0A2K3LU13_TRIPR|nr:hypothetical protein L195_g038049 [Trifolium pratense]PNX85067.1 hypothetical protein L195_g041132 [Trifolium pratense]
MEEQGVSRQRFCAPWGFVAVNLQIDSQVVLHNMKTGSDSSVARNTFLQRIRSLFELDCEVKICYSYCEAYSCADDLVNTGCDQSSTMIFK